MTTHPSLADLATQVRLAALEEATERSKKRRAASGAATGDAPIDAVKQEEELAALYQDEKSRNDVMQAQYQQRMDELAEREEEDDPTEDEEVKAKQIRLARIQFEIEQLERDLKDAPPQEALPLRDVRARAQICDVSSQLADSLASLKTQLSQEQADLERARTLLSDLQIVERGLERRQAQLEARKDRDMTSEAAIANLQKKRNLHERQMRDLLSTLISVSDRLFEQTGKKRVLRSLLDSLMNKSWDTPQDPYVLVADREAFDPALVELVVRANIAVQHPRDARRIRLVGFHRPTRTRD